MKYLVTLTLLTFVAGCADDPPPRVAAAAAPQVTTHIEAKQFLMDSDAFDLATLMAKLQEGQLKDADAITEYINSTPGINNVDLNGTGSTDPITVVEQEGQEAGKVVMAINAHPKGGDPVTVAEIEFTKTASGEVEVQGAYPEYVGGYQDNYYSYRRPMSMGDAMFYAWLFQPHRPRYYHPWGGGYYGGMGYMRPHPVMGRSELRTTRTTTRSTVSPVAKAKRPDTYKAKSAGAKKVVKKQAARKAKAAKASTVKGMAGKQSAFAKRNGNKAKPKGNNLRPKNSARPKKKSSFGGFGSSKPKSRSSFGSSRSRSSSRRR